MVSKRAYMRWAQRWPSHMKQLYQLEIYSEYKGAIDWFKIQIYTLE